MYAMEVCFLLTQDLNINLSLIIEFGPVELELLMALIIASAGVFGNQYMVTPIVEYLPFAASIIPETIYWGHFFQLLFLCLMLQGVYENLERCYNKGWVVLYFMSGPFLIFLTSLIGAYLQTETYLHYQVLYNLLYQMIINVSIYRLMICNMCKLKFEIVGIENFFGIIPLIVHVMFKDQPNQHYELLASKLCVAALFIYFYGHMALLVTQYYRRHSYRNFWFITGKENSGHDVFDKKGK